MDPRREERRLNAVPDRSAIAVAALALSVTLALPRAARAETGPVTLPDSTVCESWRLPNGLGVTTRHVPRASAVSITVAYRIGNTGDPPGREGLARLMAEAAFTAAAGEIPERTRDEMESLRPLGWSLEVGSRSTLLTEIASPAQFPGALHQVAVRMRGVMVNDRSLRTALGTVKRELHEGYSGRADLALYYQVRDAAAGLPEGLSETYASGKGLQGIGVKEVRDGLAALYVPANAVLSLAGNLSGVDLHRQIEREFGALPSGARASDPPPVALKPGLRQITRGDLASPLGVVGIIAPALTDTTHPEFYLNALVIGSLCKDVWDPPAPPLTTRFKYSVLDDPDLVRFYPPVSASTTESRLVPEEYLLTIREMPTPGDDVYASIRLGVGWLLGGSLPFDALKRARTQPGTLLLLSTSMASRALAADDGFWADYRRRLEQTDGSSFDAWRNYFLALNHRASVLFSPGKRK